MRGLKLLRGVFLALVPGLGLTTKALDCPRSAGKDVVLVQSKSGGVAVGNGMVCLRLSATQLVGISGDFEGLGNYGHDAVVGLALEREDANGTVYSSASSGGGSGRVSVREATAERAVVVLSGVADQASDSVAVETWTFTVRRGKRYVELRGQGGIKQSVQAKAVRRSWTLSPSSMHGLFEGGIVQMKNPNRTAARLASKDRLNVAYALGGWGGDLEMAGNVSVALKPVGGDRVGVLLSALEGEDNTAVQEVLAGDFTGALDTWGRGWEDPGVYAVAIQAGHTWDTVTRLYPNNADFPTHTLGPFRMPASDVRAILTGVYASPVGNINSQVNMVLPGEHVAQMATTPKTPRAGYEGTYNYFDPDNFISTAALLDVGDPYLSTQVRLVLERSGAFLTESGQLPHHFVNITPTYVALSGETQTGPNLFWVLACLNYAKSTGDLDWLRGYMPTLRKASSFLFGLIDPEVGLAKAPGSLMIDVFIRNNFTADTNAMLVGFFHDFGEAEEAVGNATGAVSLRALASSVSSAINRRLWAGDHYVTQLNPNGSTTDFVDYDSNLIALAHGVPDATRAAKVFSRVDKGHCTHGRATYVSEVYYGPNDTTNGNIGDSACSMGRIGWFDALARRRFGDQATFDNILLDPLRDDLLRWTWMHERYACDGSPQLNRTNFYFEYPSVVAMMLREIRYGINLGLTSVEIQPFGPRAFEYHIGNVHVNYSSSAAQLRLPGIGERTFGITGLLPSTTFALSVTGRPPAVVHSDRSGAVSFVAQVGTRNSANVVSLMAEMGAVAQPKRVSRGVRGVNRLQ
jgi:hypothetical protein